MDEYRPLAFSSCWKQQSVIAAQAALAYCHPCPWQTRGLAQAETQSVFPHPHSRSPRSHRLLEGRVETWIGTRSADHHHLMASRNSFSSSVWTRISICCSALQASCSTTFPVCQMKGAVRGFGHCRCFVLALTVSVDSVDGHPPWERHCSFWDRLENLHEEDLPCSRRLVLVWPDCCSRFVPRESEDAWLSLLSRTDAARLWTASTACGDSDFVSLAQVARTGDPSHQSSQHPERSPQEHQSAWRGLDLSSQA